jgi:GNAT superfamily N-acetyltransferase
VAIIRPATIQDLPGVYRVCLQTGDSGLDATSHYRNPDLLGHIYVGPYLVGFPQHAFVASDREGVAGYTFAVEDTIAFEEWENQYWWPSLRAQYPLVETGGHPRADDDETIIRLLHNPEHTPRDIVDEYPAHLHIDLLPRVHGQGLGRAFMELVIGRLRERAVAGVHFGVSVENLNAIDFYRHLGFSVLRDEPEELYMGMRLS